MDAMNTTLTMRCESSLPHKCGDWHNWPHWHHQICQALKKDVMVVGSGSIIGATRERESIPPRPGPSARVLSSLRSVFFFFCVCVCAGCGSLGRASCRKEWNTAANSSKQLTKPAPSPLPELRGVSDGIIAHSAIKEHQSAKMKWERPQQLSPGLLEDLFLFNTIYLPNLDGMPDQVQGFFPLSQNLRPVPNFHPSSIVLFPLTSSVGPGPDGFRSFPLPEPHTPRDAIFGTY
jgi:hypothetical protein